MPAQTAIRATTKGVSLSLTIVTRSGRDEIVGLEGDAIKIRLKAPPVDGKANDALVDLLSKSLRVSRSAIEIVTGASSHHKIVYVTGISLPEAQQRLLPVAP